MSKKIKPPLHQLCQQRYETTNKATNCQKQTSREMDCPQNLIRRYINQNDEYLWKRIKNALVEKTILHIYKYNISNKQKIQDAVYEVMKEVIAKIKASTTNFICQQELIKYKKQIKKIIKNTDELQNKIKRREAKIQNMENAMQSFYKMMCKNGIPKQTLHKSAGDDKNKKSVLFDECKYEDNSTLKCNKNKELANILSGIIPIMQNIQKQALSFSIRLINSTLSQHLREQNEIAKHKLAISQLNKQLSNKNKQIEEMEVQQNIHNKKMQEMKKRQKDMMIRYGEMIERMIIGFEEQKNEINKISQYKQTVLQFKIKQLIIEIQNKHKQIAQLTNNNKTNVQTPKLLSSQSTNTSPVTVTQNQQTQTFINNNCSINSQIIHISTSALYIDKSHIETQTSEIQSESQQSEYVYEFDIGTQYEKQQSIEQGTQHTISQSQQNNQQQKQRQMSQYSLQPSLESLQELKVFRINHSNTLQQLQSLRHKFITYIEQNQNESETKINELEQCLKSKQLEIESLSNTNCELLQTIQHTNSLFLNYPFKEEMSTMFPYFHKNNLIHQNKFVNTNTQSTNSQKSSEETEFVFSRPNHNNCIDQTQNFIECSEDEGEDQMETIPSKSIDKSAVSRLLAEFVNLQNKQQYQINAFVTLIGMLNLPEKQEKIILAFLHKKKSRMVIFHRDSQETTRGEKMELKDKLYQFFTDF